MLVLSGATRVRTVFAFKTPGAPAGATLSHAHSQLVAMPVVPPGLAEELRGAKKHFDDKERCVYCDVLAQELREKERIVTETERMLILCPSAARSPFETWILPNQHASA